MEDFFEDNNQNQSSQGNLLQTLLRDYVPYWPVILAAALIGLIGSTLYLRYQRPVYGVSSAILFKNDAQNTDNLIKEAVLGQGSTTIEDLMELLKLELLQLQEHIVKYYS